MRSIDQTARPSRVYGEDRSGGRTIIYDTVHAPLGRVWPNALAPMRSACRPDKGKGIHQHRCSRAHSEVVEAYRAVRRHEELAAEEATYGYDTELAEYWRDHPRTTFRDYLIGTRNRARAEDDTEE